MCLKCLSMVFKFVRSFEEMIKVLFVINQICCHGDYDAVVTLRMIEEHAITNCIQE